MPQPRAMVTPAQRRALTKEGYKIIGTHSAVKLCRWTKHQLRGRGGCYKHTFYGITSYQCMEATPSLACANKCVFCWRHHKNPVGREWRWQTDEPEQIVEEGIQNHVQLIKMMRGVPGLRMDRWREAFTVKHCALSLVGEPIMYPHINRFVRLLHAKQISSFLVTNAQFPEAITALEPVTQLYVSVDAATKDTLKAIDRPLFRDFWERFEASLCELGRKRQRTVYRLTLVKRMNMDELEDYCRLIEMAAPDFIEVKSVTYCGKSDGSELTIRDVPYHAEVREFCELMAARLARGPLVAGADRRTHGDGGAAAGAEAGLSSSSSSSSSLTTTVTASASRAVVTPPAYETCSTPFVWDADGRAPYGLATEHEHSCCVLLAHKKFLVGGQWHTWIDYPRFHELVQAYYASEGAAAFTSLDYIAPTPAWALYNSPERGFDPVETRFRRTKDGKVTEEEYKPSGSGCG